MEFEQVIKARRTIRRFEPGHTVPREVINQIIESAMYAPNVANRRSWEFFVVENKEMLNQIVSVHPAGKTLKDAAAIITVCGRPDLNQPLPDDFIPLNCAAAVENMLLTAVNLGYGAGWVGAYPDPKKMEDIQKLFGTDGLPIASVAIGIPAEAPEAKGFWEPEKVHYL